MTDNRSQARSPRPTTDSATPTGPAPTSSLEQRIVLDPIGRVSSPRTAPLDDDWEAITATITLDPDRFSPESLLGLDTFSHVEVVYVFDRVAETSIQTSSRHPRGNRAWPKVGVFAQRAKGRPNRIGVSVCQLLGVEQLEVRVRALDAIDGSPVLDLKPYMREFAPRGEVRQPQWSHELMAGYWSAPDLPKDQKR